MSTWLNDTHSGLSNDNGAFNPSLDPSMAFMQIPTSAPFDFNQLQNQQLQQRMHNGNVRNGSPAFQNPMYQTHAVVPSKRPRPREDSMGASPRQPTGALPTSRSQTPQQVPYPGFQGSTNGGQQFQAPTAYQHLQHTGSNASSSPTMQNQNFNSQSVPQRVQTISPSPFSPAVQAFGSQASPAHSDQGSQVNTPQNGAQHFGQGMPYNGGSGQPFTPPTGSSSGAIPSSQYAQVPSSLQQQQQQQQRMYEIRQQQLSRHLQPSNAAAQQRHPGSALNPATNPSNQMASYQMAARSQQMQQNMMRSRNPDDFMRTLAHFMQQRGLPLNPNPTAAGRPINIGQVFMAVMKHGGSKKVTTTSQWPSIAAFLQIPPIQCPSAGQEIQNYWHINVSAYEHVWWQTDQQRRQRAMAEQMQATHHAQGGDISAHDQFSPVKPITQQMHDQQAQHPMQPQRQTQAEHQTPVKQMIPQPNESRHPHQNGFLTPQSSHLQGRHSNFYGQSQQGQSFAPQVTPPQAQQPPFPSQPGSANSKKETYAGTNLEPVVSSDPASSMPRKAPIDSNFVPKFQHLEKRKDGVESHGGIQVSSFRDIVDQVVLYKPNVPTIQELGMIDIRALTMSLRSGIHAEVRLALDTLASLSIEPRPPSLEDCEDLMETLIDCAEEQVELLAENAVEVSDVMLISPYEEIVRGCRFENETLQEVPEFGSLDYDLDRSVDRLICITTILRNLSFFETNFPLLADPIVVKFMTTVIRYLGTRNLLLRTYRNTLDFTKDIVIYLSNLSHTIDLPSKEEASCMLHFLLSFAPCPPPTNAGSEEVMFSSYNPSTHPYLPPAVDSLAKLLARDDPNRTFYRSIFAADNSSTPPYDLLTRTFALAIAPIPEHGKLSLLATVEARKPYLAQGMLAAEILASLVPSQEHALAQSWLSSQDGFAMSLVRLVSLLSSDRASVSQRHPSGGRIADLDPQAYGMITHRGIAVLRKLAERARDAETPGVGIPTGVLPRRESLIGALLTTNIDGNVVRQLCAYSGMEI
ncbi:hypothetical protein MMC12_000741 [Toensbergia leucococca]|nr:hypothetical protein [Toensbergia leucococca]